MLCRTSDAKPLGMSCCVPIFRAAGLWVLRTTEGEGEGEIDGESEGESEAKETEEEEDACLASCEEAGESGGGLKGARPLSSRPLSAGDGERGVGGSEEVREEREGMLEVELCEGVGVRRAGGEGLDA